MAGLHPLPPHVLHSSTRLTHAQAHAHLDRFLENAENDAAYRPDSTLTERGPQSASTGANPNLTLHHLRRILQGIEGKRIGGEGVRRFFGEGAKLSTGDRKRKFEGEGKTQRAQARRKQIPDSNPEDERLGPGMAVDEEQDGWQDKEDYDLAQEDDGLDMMAEERHPGANLEEPVNDEEAEDMVEIKIGKTGRKVGLSEQHAQSSTVDKDARKKAKKERAKIRNREKEEAKARAK